MGEGKGGIRNSMPISKRNFDSAVADLSTKIQRMSEELSQQLGAAVDALNDKADGFAGHTDMVELSGKIERASNKIRQLEEKVSSFTGLAEEIEELRQKQDAYHKTLIEQIGYSRYLMLETTQDIDMKLERKYYEDFPTEEDEKHPNFAQDYINLVKDLDEESIHTVVNELLGLKRLRLYDSVDCGNIYTVEEQREKRQMDDHFTKVILKLAADKYAYRHYILPVSHFEAPVFYYRYGMHLIQNKERMKQLDVIDAGAFIGDSALIFSEETSGKIHCFEPNPVSYDLMLKTKELNHNEQIVPVPKALGDKNGQIELYIMDSATTEFTNPAFEYSGKVTAPVMTLDEYVSENHLKIGLIKADLEGAEQLMLQGAYCTIKEQKPILLISIYHNADDFFHIKPLIESWNLGYKFKIYHPPFGSIMTETVLIAEAEE